MPSYDYALDSVMLDCGTQEDLEMSATVASFIGLSPVKFPLCWKLPLLFSQFSPNSKDVFCNAVLSTFSLEDMLPSGFSAKARQVPDNKRGCYMMVFSFSDGNTEKVKRLQCTQWLQAFRNFPDLSLFSVFFPQKNPGSKDSFRFPRFSLLVLSSTSLTGRLMKERRARQDELQQESWMLVM